VTIDSRESNMARYTDHWLQPVAGKEGALLNAAAQVLAGRRINLKNIAKNAGVEEDKMKNAVEGLKASEHLAVIVGPTVFSFSDNAELLDAVFELAKRPNTIIMPLYHGANSRGALELGAFGELLPGVVKSKGAGLSLAEVMGKNKRPKVLYLIGQTPFSERPDCDFLICQDIYDPPFPVDAFLPAASFAEAGGTLTNIEGRVQEIIKIENLPEGSVTGFMRPDWRIFSDLSRKLDGQALKFRDEEEILREIHETVPGFPAKPDREPRQLKAGSEPIIEKKNISPDSKGDFLLVVAPAGFQHRGIDLSCVVEGLGELALEQGLRLNPDDLDKLGIKPGEPVTVSLNSKKITVSAKADAECRAGTAYLYRPINFGGLAECKYLEFFHALDSNPAKVSLE